MQANILLFDDFQTLDAFGPIEVLGRVAEYQLRLVSINGGLVRSRQNTTVSTEKLDLANTADLILIPGGQGTRVLVHDKTFIALLRKMVGRCAYCLSVCTGAALLAKTGLLNGLPATSNKIAFDWVESVNNQVLWQKEARWVVAGKYYTSAGVSAGIDMTLGFVADRFGRQRALDIAHQMEYCWHENADNANPNLSAC